MSQNGNAIVSMNDSEDRRRHLPAYVLAHFSGVLRERVPAAYERLRACDLCPRACGVNRLEGEIGYCRAGVVARVAAWNVHPWEEPPLSGTRGSGTIFFSHCTGRCLFCQNYPISQLGIGQDAPAERLADMMLTLQRKGCHNINLVTPTHYVPQILEALEIATIRGLRLPLLYNTSGYETRDTLRLLDGIIDIYLPDAKYADDDIAQRLSGFHGYVQHNRASLKEIFRQVGQDLLCDEHGLAIKGMIVRHLVLPGGLSQTPQVLRWLAQELSPHIHVSLMAQYFAAYRAVGHPELGRKLRDDEYEAALEAFEAAGLERGWRQELDPLY